MTEHSGALAGGTALVARIDEEAYLRDLRHRQILSRPGSQPLDVSYPLGEIALSEYLRRWAQLQPDRVALTFYGRDFTFAELDDLSDRFAGWLERRGLRPGDRVGLALPNCPQFVIAFFGILKSGAVHVPVNPMMRARELAHELADADVSLVLALNTLAEELALAREVVQLPEVYYLDFADHLPEMPTIALPAHSWLPPAGAPASSWDRIIAGEPTSVRGADVDALAALNYTGGTMGLPKGCEHTQRHMVYTAATTAAAWKLGEHFGGSAADVSLVFVPVFWIGGQDLALLVPILTGTRCVLMARWDAPAVMRAVEEYTVTHMVGAVDCYVEMLDLPDRDRFDLSSLRMTLGASFVRKLDPEIRQAWSTFAGSVLREGAFGMTETHSMDTSTEGFQAEDFDLLGRPVFCGLPVPGTDIKIVSFETGRLLPVGAEGEIAVRSPSITTGYWRSPDATAGLLRNGWLHTGDVGMIAENGCLHFLGRRKEMLKVKGMSVFPAEVESLLSAHPEVQSVAVVPKLDEGRGEIPVAFVELLPTGSVTAAELTLWARGQMSAYKVPEVHVVTSLPRTDTGKIKKGVLLAELSRAERNES